MKSVAVLISLIYCLFSFSVKAEAPTCRVHESGPYCKYYGKVKNLYINEGNLLLMYFDAAGNISDIRSHIPEAWSGSVHVAAAYNTADNPDFANKLYSTLLTAQASKRKVSIQMRGVTSGYLKIDRVWLAEE